MTNKNWDLIRAIHSDKTHIPPSIVDYIAVEDILRSCASGLSNKDISEIMYLDTPYVIDVIKYFLEFGGWQETLPINPLLLLEEGDTESFYKFQLTEDSIKLAYNVCLRYNKIKEKIDEFYG